ncbi:MAG: glycine cleavage system protein GcvH [Actinomycetota bacterium]
MEFPEDLRYTKDHEWVRTEGDGRVRIGITDYAQDSLGDVVYVDVPAAGTAVTRDRPLGEVESTKSVSEIFAPLSGTVVESNAALGDRPELVNGDPYGEGWIAVLELAPGEDPSSLMDAAAYRALVGGDA